MSSPKIRRIRQASEMGAYLEQDLAGTVLVNIQDNALGFLVKASKEDLAEQLVRLYKWDDEVASVQSSYHSYGRIVTVCFRIEDQNETWE